MLEELRGGKKTAKDLADVLSIQVSAARRHLENLSELNIVREEFAQEGMGRPKKYYSLTEEGRELYPRQYEKFLCGLLDKLVGSNGQVGESVVKQIAHEMALEMKSDGQATVDEGNGGIETLLGALNDFGFDCDLENQGSRIVITSRNCPLYKAAIRHQKIVCHGLHDEMLKVAFNSKDVRLEQSLSRGDNACRHIIEKPS